MKFRTDFVTNSSSSSFIFRKKPSSADYKRFQDTLKFCYKELNADEAYFENDRKYAQRNLKYIFENIAPLGAYDDDVCECFDWYSEEVWNSLLDAYTPATDQAPSTPLSREILRRIMAGAVLKNLYMLPCMAYNKEINLPVRKKRTILTRTDLQMFLDSYIDNGNYRSKIWMCLMEHWVDASEIILGFAGLPLGELVAIFLDATYMYYDNYTEPNYLVSKLLIADENCIYGCNHMG